jgi:hypothetical protein
VFLHSLHALHGHAPVANPTAGLFPLSFLLKKDRKAEKRRIQKGKEERKNLTQRYFKAL